ncbi:MAG: type II toxin-antitoxin system CcdA family antitoxin [Luteimonas sp.]|nr:type II toxin-antitoxin system CcdA family antitoxin [Luteimonas sp.]
MRNKAPEAEVRARKREQWPEENRGAVAACSACIARGAFAGDHVRAFKGSLEASTRS